MEITQALIDAWEYCSNKRLHDDLDGPVPMEDIKAEMERREKRKNGLS